MDTYVNNFIRKYLIVCIEDYEIKPILKTLLPLRNCIITKIGHILSQREGHGYAIKYINGILFGTQTKLSIAFILVKFEITKFIPHY